MPPPSSPDDAAAAWLDVLAGRAEPHDTDTRRAAQLRAHFEYEWAAVPDRPERTKALLNLMEARVQLAAAAQPTARDSLWQRLSKSLMLGPAGGWMNVGRAVLGVSGIALLVTMMLPPTNQEGGDPPTTKEASGANGSEASKESADTGATLRVHEVPDPMGQGLALEAKLLMLGLTVKTTPTNDGLRLKLQVPAAQREAVQTLLANEGLGNEPLGATLDLVLRPAQGPQHQGGG